MTLSRHEIAPNEGYNYRRDQEALNRVAQTALFITGLRVERASGQQMGKLQSAVDSIRGVDEFKGYLQTMLPRDVFQLGNMRAEYGLTGNEIDKIGHATVPAFGDGGVLHPSRVETDEVQAALNEAYKKYLPDLRELTGLPKDVSALEKEVPLAAPVIPSPSEVLDTGDVSSHANETPTTETLAPQPYVSTMTPEAAYRARQQLRLLEAKGKFKCVDPAEITPEESERNVNAWRGSGIQDSVEATAVQSYESPNTRPAIEEPSVEQISAVHSERVGISPESTERAVNYITLEEQRPADPAYAEAEEARARAKAKQRHQEEELRKRQEEAFLEWAGSDVGAAHAGTVRKVLKMMIGDENLSRDFGLAGKTSKEQCEIIEEFFDRYKKNRHDNQVVIGPIKVSCSRTRFLRRKQWSFEPGAILPATPEEVDDIDGASRRARAKSQQEMEFEDKADQTVRDVFLDAMLSRCPDLKAVVESGSCFSMPLEEFYKEIGDRARDDKDESGIGMLLACKEGLRDVKQSLERLHRQGVIKVDNNENGQRIILSGQRIHEVLLAPARKRGDQSQTEVVSAFNS